MEGLRRRPLLTTTIAYALAAAAVAGIAGAWGFPRFGHAFSHARVGWLGLAIGAELLTFPAYVLAYRAIAQLHGGPRIGLGLVARLVVAGFGPFAAGGGFAMDKRALHAIERDETAATTRVLGMGALEWALLAPAAWAAAVALLASGDRRPLPSLLWPWAVAVPLGFAIGLPRAAPLRHTPLKGAGRRFSGALARALRSVAMLFTLAGEFRRCWSAWLGSALYWTCDIAALYGSAAFVGLHLNPGELVVGYATGYALTRRSLPLGGAGAVEVLMTFSLHWVGQPVPGALAAVVVYRVFNFVLPTLPALAARPGVEPLLLRSEPASAMATTGGAA